MKQPPSSILLTLVGVVVASVLGVLGAIVAMLVLTLFSAVLPFSMALIFIGALVIPFLAPIFGAFAAIWSGKVIEHRVDNGKRGLPPIKWQGISGDSGVITLLVRLSFYLIVIIIIATWVGLI